ncbi:hypothetical protein [Sphingomonas cavernae]|uniref:PRC-barrel domain-containing protein n=1 Tax=Sphingomonas cavernae TaxID=2320861 RepID=A0A418WMZ8_9SPHN|nr:hypothetical protein [Sphingomonas cavernae]RJF91373.1 hypothetical protein D3876_14850 [Sphingomonas cavernae]
MRLFVASAVALLAISAPVAAIAQDAAAAATAPARLKNGVTLYSADGKRLGKVNRVAADVVTIIFDSRFVRVPTNSVSEAEGKLVTSLDYAAVRKIK